MASTSFPQILFYANSILEGLAGITFIFLPQLMEKRPAAHDIASLFGVAMICIALTTFLSSPGTPAGDLGAKISLAYHTLITLNSFRRVFISGNKTLLPAAFLHAILAVLFAAVVFL